MYQLMHHHLTNAEIWIGIGFFGQAMFTARFFLQWLASEKARKSVIPHSFWYFSIAGSAILLAYAIYRQDPVFILGQGPGLLIYMRNIYFIHRPSAATLQDEKIAAETSL